MAHSFFIIYVKRNEIPHFELTASLFEMKLQIGFYHICHMPSNDAAIAIFSIILFFHWVSKYNV